MDPDACERSCSWGRSLGGAAWVGSDCARLGASSGRGSEVVVGLSVFFVRGVRVRFALVSASSADVFAAEVSLEAASTGVASAAGFFAREARFFLDVVPLSGGEVAGESVCASAAGTSVAGVAFGARFRGAAFFRGASAPTGAGVGASLFGGVSVDIGKKDGLGLGGGEG